MPFLIGVVVLIVFLLIVYFYFKLKINGLLKKYYGTTNLKIVLETVETTEQETPKSLGSLDCLYLNNLQKDFNLNINELKRLAEGNILEILEAIEKKDLEVLNNKNEKILAFVKRKINDYQDESVSFQKVKIHNTVLNKYEKSDGIATIYLATSLEYIRKIGNNQKKIQNRIKTEFIYIFDDSKVKDSLKSLGLNCPNCGAPIRSLHHKKCAYCKSIVMDFFKKTFVLNDVKEY